MTTDSADNMQLSERWRGLVLRLLPIDEVDVRILSRLRENARLSNVEIEKPAPPKPLAAPPAPAAPAKPATPPPAVPPKPAPPPVPPAPGGS